MELEQLDNLENLEKKQLVLRITGAVEQSNLAEFEQQALTVIAGINLTLETDEQFSEAEDNIKSCQLMENRIATARGTALANTAAIAELIQTTERLEAKFRETRLTLKNKVRTEKDRRVSEIMNGGRNRVNGLLINSPVKHGFSFDNVALTAAAKGKRSLAKMQEAVDEVVESEELRLANMEADYLANLEKIAASEAQWPGLFPDKANVALSAPETVAALIVGREASFRLQAEEKARREKEEADRVAANKLRKEQEEAITEAAPKAKQEFAELYRPVMPPDPIWIEALSEISNPFTDLPLPPPPLKTYRLTVTASASKDWADRLVDIIGGLGGVETVGCEELP